MNELRLDVNADWLDVLVTLELSHMVLLRWQKEYKICKKYE